MKKCRDCVIPILVDVNDGVNMIFWCREKKKHVLPQTKACDKFDNLFNMRGYGCDNVTASKNIATHEIYPSDLK